MVCPITFALFKVPVVNKYGNMYEEDAIKRHVQVYATDPLSNQRLTPGDPLFLSRAMQQMCEEWRKNHPQYDDS